MNPINIEITKAVLKQYTVTLTDDGLPSVEATIALLTTKDKKISTFTVGTDSWRDVHFDLTSPMIPPIVQIAKQLEEIVTRECTKALCLLQ